MMNKIHIFRTEEEYLPVENEHFRKNRSMYDKLEERLKSRKEDYWKQVCPLEYEEYKKGTRQFLGISKDVRTAIHKDLAEGLELICMVRLDAFYENYYFQTEINMPADGAYGFQTKLINLVEKVREEVDRLGSSNSTYSKAIITPFFYTVEESTKELKECEVNPTILESLIKQFTSIPQYIRTAVSKNLATDSANFAHSRRALSKEERETFEKLWIKSKVLNAEYRVIN